ncbi:MAG: DJ-1/PfpI family protein [Bacteroidales bacterium]|nr:DJ-1/PfpI family protein [Bacteroidales bacterium]
MKRVSLYLADGFEDVEALGTRDVLIRGGVGVRLVAIGDEPFVTSSHGVTVGVDDCLPDLDLAEADTDASDMMIFPGGMPGTKNLAACKPLIKLMNEHYAKGGSVAAVCAAPGFVLSQLEGFAGTEFTCFEGCQAPALEAGGIYNPLPAIRCGRIITGRSAGHALTFALEILRFLKGDGVAEEVRHALYL